MVSLFSPTLLSLAPAPVLHESVSDLLLAASELSASPQGIVVDEVAGSLFGLVEYILIACFLLVVVGVV